MNERTIFLTALEKTGPGQRQQYLDEACGDDQAMRKQVEQLLSAHQHADSFLENPPPQFVPTIIPADSDTVDGGDGDIPLDFLNASDKPGCIGTVGPYEVIEVLGRGGMGIVLKAYDPKLSRVVAIKVLAPELAANPSACKRFLREGRAAAAVSHDHVVTIHGIDDGGRLPFIVMEYISGQSLQQRIDTQGALELKEVLRIGKQAAAGLAAAHAEGLIHRDIKPANMLLENGVERVKITDFGLARAVDDVRITQPGVVTGTPEYMSPEQARGESVDHRSDLFSLGSVLYAMCTGRPPFRAENTVAMIRRVCDDQPRTIEQVNPEIPFWLVRAIERLLAKDPDTRFQSASEVADLLGKCLAHVQQPSVILAPPDFEDATGRTVHSKRSGWQRRWVAAAAVLLAATAGFSLTEASGVTDITSTIIRVIRGDGTVVVEVDDPSVEVSIDGEEIVISGAGPKEIRVRPGKHEVVATRDGETLHSQLVAITRGGKQIVKVSREGAAFLDRQETQAPRRPSTELVWADAKDLMGAPSSDGRHFSFVDWDTGDLAVHNLVSDKNRRLTNKGSWSQSDENAEYSIFSPDDKQLAYTWSARAGQVELRIIGADGSEPRVVYRNEDVVYARPVAWSADGEQILAVFLRIDRSTQERTFQIVFVSVKDSSEHVLKTLDSHWPTSVCLSPDGQHIAYGSPADKGDIYLLAADGSGETTLVEHSASDYVLGWTPDGERLLFASDRSGTWDAWLIRVSGGKAQGSAELVRPNIGPIVPKGFREHGSFYYAVWTRMSDVYFATLDLETGKVVVPPVPVSQNIVGSNSCPDWSPDGMQLAYLSLRGLHPRSAQATIRIRNLQTKQERELLPRLRTIRDSGLQWSPDGRSLLVTGLDHQSRQGVFVIDAQTAEVTSIKLENIMKAEWTPDGNVVFYSIEKSPRIVHRDLKTGQERKLYDASGRTQFALSPDGRRAAITTRTGANDAKAPAWILQVVSVSGGKPRELLRVQEPESIQYPSWTPDGRHILFDRSGQDETKGLWRMSAQGGQPQKLELTARTRGQLRLHADGRRVAFSANPKVEKSEIWVMKDFLPEPTQEKQSSQIKYKEETLTATTQLVWDDAADWTYSGRPSPDGRYLSYVDWDTCDLGIHEIATGKSRLLTNEGPAKHARYSVFSPDSRQIAYQSDNKKSWELRIIDVDGSEPRTLYSSEEDYWILPTAWSPDGKWIAAFLAPKDGNYRIALVSVVDGSLRTLKPSYDGYQWPSMSFSPDGRYLACSLSQEADRKNGERMKGDIFLLATDTGDEVPVVEHPAHDLALGWAPDGKRLMFASDRTSTRHTYSIEIVDGHPQGTPEMIRQMGEFKPLGLTHDGSFYYGRDLPGENIYTVALDPDSHKVLGEPEKAIPIHEGHQSSPAWSADGKYLACRGRLTENEILIRSMETGRVRVLKPQFTGNGGLSFHHLRWSPDGRSFLAGGSWNEGKRGLLQIDVETGDVTMLVEGKISAADWSPDGKTVFYKCQFEDGKHRRLIRRDLASGETKVLCAGRDFGRLTISPDGGHLAFLSAGEGENTTGVYVVSVDGGEPRQLAEMMESALALAWTRDARHLLFGKGEKETQLWRVPVEGGQAEKLGLKLNWLRHLCVHPDGRRITFNLSEGKSQVWMTEDFAPR